MKKLNEFCNDSLYALFQWILEFCFNGGKSKYPFLSNEFLGLYNDKLFPSYKIYPSVPVILMFTFSAEEYEVNIVPKIFLLNLILITPESILPLVENVFISEIFNNFLHTNQ